MTVDLVSKDNVVWVPHINFNPLFYVSDSFLPITVNPVLEDNGHPGSAYGCQPSFLRIKISIFLVGNVDRYTS